MVLIDYCNKYLLLASNITIVIYNTHQRIFKTIKLNECSHVHESEVNFKPKDLKNSNIRTITISPNCKTLAVTTASKQLHIYDIDNELKVNHFKTYCLNRGCSALRFNEGSNLLMIADKAGDVYQCKKDNNWTPTLLLGHLSMLLDVQISTRNEYIITCDRDEKIRVSSYPDTFNIQSYCLGHEEYVSALAFLPQDNNVLISCSGDATLKCWFYLNGLELLSIKLPKPASSMKVSKIAESHTHVALLLYESNTVYIYEISINNESKKIESREVQQIELSCCPTGLVFGENSLWIVVAAMENAILQYTYEGSQYIKQECLKAEELKDVLVAEENPNNFIATLFKTKFNNVEEYHVKKKQRIEQKKSNSRPVV